MKKKSRPHTPNTIEKSSGIQRKINTKKKYRLEKKRTFSFEQITVIKGECLPNMI